MQYEQIAQDKETYARLTAPQHIVNNHFSEHKKVEGFFENRNVPQFMGSDRLFRLDTIYGTVQMGYSPGKKKSFIFANIKTSIYDTAASRFQKEIREKSQISRHLRTGTKNKAISSRRRWGSAVILYKAETLPWSPRSVAPYLRRANLEALKKTMPFLDKNEEISDRGQIRSQQRNLQNDLQSNLLSQNYAEMAAIRAQQVADSTRQDMLNAIIYRKDQQRLLFFRRLNSSLDSQKYEMFAYYRNKRKGGSSARSDENPAENNPKPNEAEE
ncbi:MAG: hypothetical protein FWC91_08510 [Defluviitaleaceae bacterium]|nr:hypothetical protein [Defluviitaleaceae bacterium]